MVETLAPTGLTVLRTGQNTARVSCTNGTGTTVVMFDDNFGTGVTPGPVTTVRASVTNTAYRAVAIAPVP